MNLISQKNLADETRKIEVCRNCGHSVHPPEAINCEICDFPLGKRKFWTKKTKFIFISLITFFSILAISLLTNPLYFLPSKANLDYWGPPCQQRLISQQIMRKVNGMGENKFNLRLLDVYQDRDAYTELIDGQIDLVMHEKTFLDKHYQQADIKGVPLESRRYAIDGIAYIANKDVDVSYLSVDEITKIYSGQITNWKYFEDRGGRDLTIRPILLGGLGQNSIFLDLRQLNPNNIYVSDRETAIRKLKSTPGAFFYTSASLAVHDRGIKIISLYKPGLEEGKGEIISPVIDGRPNLEAFRDGSYPQLRGLFVAYRGDLTGEKKKWTDSFINMLLSPEGQQIVKEAGFLPVKPILEEKKRPIFFDIFSFS